MPSLPGGGNPYLVSMLRSLPLIVCLLLTTQTAIGQDWANLSRFQPANTELMANSVTGRVVFMGDSITEGWDLEESFPGLPFVNRGISGQTTPQMLVRFRPDVLDLEPAAVVILAGTNDIAGNTGPMTLEQIAGNIASMAELADANGVRPVICSVLPAREYPWRPGLRPDVKIPELNRLLEEYAASKGFAYLDYFSAMTDGENGLQADLTYDEVHITAPGYAVMTRLAGELLRTLLGDQD